MQDTNSQDYGFRAIYLCFFFRFFHLSIAVIINHGYFSIGYGRRKKKCDDSQNLMSCDTAQSLRNNCSSVICNVKSIPRHTISKIRWFSML